VVADDLIKTGRASCLGQRLGRVLCCNARVRSWPPRQRVAVSFGRNRTIAACQRTTPITALGSCTSSFFGASR